MSGGKGGSQTQAVEIPQWLEDASQRNIGRAEQAQQLGYMPYYGPDVAAFTPAQQTAMQSSYDAAAAFGLAPQGGDVMAGMPQAQDFGGGMMGYSSAPLYEQALAELAAKQPGQVSQYNRMFIDPITGAPAETFMKAQAEQAVQPAQSEQAYQGGNGDEYSGGGDNTYASNLNLGGTTTNTTQTVRNDGMSRSGQEDRAAAAARAARNY